MSARAEDIVVALGIVGLATASLILGLLGRTTGQTLAIIGLVLLVPRFVRALERQSPSQRTAEELMRRIYRRAPVYVVVGCVLAVWFVINAAAHLGQEPGRAIVEVVAAAVILLESLRLLLVTRHRT